MTLPRNFWKEVTEGPKPEKRRTSRVLLVLAYGRAVVLVCESSLALDFLQEDDSTAGEDGFVFKGNISFDGSISPDVALTGSGVFIGQLELEDEGVGDGGPDSREFSNVLGVLRPATSEEWKSHCNGDWPWEVT